MMFSVLRVDGKTCSLTLLILIFNLTRYLLLGQTAQIYLTPLRMASDNHPLMKSVQKNRVSKGSRRLAEPGAAKLSRFARRLLAEWKRLALPVADERVVVAVSGGADSVALLLALDELLKRGRLDLRLMVAHLDHGLRGKTGAADARWVKELASGLGFRIELARAAVKNRVALANDNLEQAARRARYEFLTRAAERHETHLVLTGHTMDDQAETVLLRLLRGSGAEGLAGMEPVRKLMTGSDCLLVRPMLHWARRAETEKYCRERSAEFRQDAMNEDDQFARVRVRRRLLPLMETFNPRIVESLARTSQLLREDAEVLNAWAEELLRAARVQENRATESEKGACLSGALDVHILAGAPSAIRRRALRLWIAGGRGDLRRLELVHLLGVEKLLEGERGGRIAELPGGSFVERRGGNIRLRVK